jgi:hypothetical protein
MLEAQCLKQTGQARENPYSQGVGVKHGLAKMHPSCFVIDVAFVPFRKLISAIFC